MESAKLAGLEPASFFQYFEEISAIPHGSGNTKAISDYLVSFARKHGLRFIQDPLNNVILFQDGTCGMEDHDPLILQGHMDMVCEKDADCPIDMATQGLDLTHDGEYVFARGTTLGGDDGISIAYALALLADPSIPHPPLEVIFTVDEETGMYGATDIDLSMLKGRRLINLDTECEGLFTAGCAGGVKSILSLPLNRKPVYGPCVKLTVDALQGGHSGSDIKRKRANACKIMGILLDRVQKLFPISISSLQGGAKNNAIPRSCTVTFVALGMYIERINEITAQLEQELRANFDEPYAIVSGDDVDALGANALSAEDSAKVIKLLNTVPNGIQAWSPDMEDMVQTSLNLGILNLGENLTLQFALRSSVTDEKLALAQQLRTIAQEFGADYSQMGEYPAWEYRADSPLRETMVSVYRQMYGTEPRISVIHAGLECGILGSKLPGLDCISMGPSVRDVHTSRERMDIASVGRTWNYLQELLKAL